MPNWCYNRVDIYGSAEDIAKFDKMYLKNNRFFENVIPIPEELKNTTSPNYNEEQVKEFNEKYGYNNWYDFCVSRWGTKWDIELSTENINIEEDTIYMNFSTAWGPPAGIYYAIKEEFPDLEISWFYDEPGMQFAGYLNNE